MYTLTPPCPGPISEGNAQADKLAGAVIIPDQFAEVRLSHDFYRQNAKALQLTSDQARQIIQSCRNCQIIAPAPSISIDS